MGANAYEKRDLLQRSATEAEVKASLVMDQKWVPYPAYSDRNGWNDLLGDYRNDIIKQARNVSTTSGRWLRQANIWSLRSRAAETLWRNPTIATLQHSVNCSWLNLLRVRDDS